MIMNKIFDENKISTFRDLKDLTTSNKLVGRREIIIGIDERAIEELRNYIYKADMFDEYLTAKCDSYEKCWEQANRDIQNYGKELREYVASLLYDNDYKSQKIERLNNIINELERTFVNDDKRIKEYNIEHPESPLDNYSRYYLDKIKELKGGK